LGRAWDMLAFGLAVVSQPPWQNAITGPFPQALFPGPQASFPGPSREACERSRSASGPANVVT
jgi:hypothetical protein